MNLQGSTLDSLVQGNYRHALIPAKSDKGLVVYAIEPLETPQKDVVERYEINYNHSDAPTIITVNSTLRGYEAEHFRQTLHNNSVDYIEDIYLEYYQNRFDELTSADKIQISDNRHDNVITIIEKYESQSALVYDDEQSNDRNASFVLSVYAESITADLSLPSDKRRHQPLAQAHPVYVKHKILLTHDNSWDIEDGSYRISNDYFDYSATNTRMGKNSLVLNYELKTLANVVSVADSRRYLNDLSDMLDNPYYGVVFSVARSEMETTKLDTQLNLIGNWFSQNIELLSQSKEQ